MRCCAWDVSEEIVRILQEVEDGMADILAMRSITALLDHALAHSYRNLDLRSRRQTLSDQKGAMVFSQR